MSSYNMQNEMSGDIAVAPAPRQARVFMGPETSREALLKTSNMSQSEAVVKTKSKTASGRTPIIFMGPEKSRETTLEKISSGFQWNESTEAEYMARVKEKATKQVHIMITRAEERSKAILATAHAKAEHFIQEQKENSEKLQKQCQENEKIFAEAERIKAEAREEGYKAGIVQAQDEFLAVKQEHAQATGKVLLSIHEQCITIFNSWRDDLANLMLEAVEKSTGYLLDNAKTDLLRGLLDKSVEALLDKREYQIKASPHDAPTLQELLEAKDAETGKKARWTLTVDNSLEVGSLILESPSAYVKNTREERASVVNEVLQQMGLPLGNGDQEAFDAITKRLLEEADKSHISLYGDEPAPISVPQEATQEAMEQAVTAPVQEVGEPVQATVPPVAAQETAQAMPVQEPAEAVEHSVQAEQIVQAEQAAQELKAEQASIEENQLDVSEMPPPFA